MASRKEEKEGKTHTRSGKREAYKKTPDDGLQT